MTKDVLIGALRVQAGACGNLGSPFYEALLNHIADDVAADGPTAALLAPWNGAGMRRLFDEAVPLRIANAFSHLAQSGEAPGLEATWPLEGAPVDADKAWLAARAAIADHRAHLEAFMTHEPQTNEVRRTAGLLGGFLTVAAETDLPLRSFEIGASAGLNQFWDRFRYEMGAVAWGDPGSRVRVDADWQGGAPPLVQVEVAERAACDRRPTDLTDQAQRRRLLACIWPDMFDRLDRSRRAIDLALDAGVQVDAADALDWTKARVAPKAGFATVLYHSVFWQYLPAETQAGLADAIQRIGAQATTEAPFAWLRFEPAADNIAQFEVRLTVWPACEDRKLAEVHPHGAWVRWAG